MHGITSVQLKLNHRKKVLDTLIRHFFGTNPAQTSNGVINFHKYFVVSLITS